MRARSSRSGARRLFRDRRGFVFALFAVSLVLLLALAGFAIDTSRGYLTQAELARAVDATALAGAKNVRQGTSEATTIAEAVSSANGLEPDPNESLTIQITSNDDDETAVNVQGARTIPTTFMRVLGFDDLDVTAEAEAIVPPIDLVLVLDQSGSMFRNNAWEPLQDAAIRFVGSFSDDLDQIGVVHFSTMAELAYPMQDNFTAGASQRIAAMVARTDGDTNSEEGLTFAHREIRGSASREKALKVIVFFTDGRPTGFRHEDGTDIGGQDGILTVATTNVNKVIGWYRGPENVPAAIKPDDVKTPPARCKSVPTCDTSPGLKWKEKEVRDTARQETLDNAAVIRQDGILVYSIGLGNLSLNNLEKPDEDFLKEIANVDGKAKGEPVGGYFFAERPEDLDAVFQAVAQDILARLAF